MGETPAYSDEDIRQIERDATRYTHRVFSKGLAVCSAGGETFEIDEVVQYGEFGDVYIVNSSRGKFQMRTEVLKPPEAYASFGTVATFVEDVMALKDPSMKRHFLIAEGVACDTSFKYLFTQQIGMSLVDVRRHHVGANFPADDALNLSIQCYFTIEYMHEMGWVHGDLTLPSFSLGVGTEENIVYLNHFGRIRKHLDPKTGRNVNARYRVPFMPRNVVFAPRSAHKRQDYGRKDDLESWLYITADLFDDSALMWKPKKPREVKAEEYLLNLKEQLFAGNAEVQNQFLRSLPIQFHSLLPIINGLDYANVPNYEVIRNAFALAKAQLGCKTEHCWIGHWKDPKKYPLPMREKGNNQKKSIVKKKADKKEEEDEGKKKNRKPLATEDEDGGTEERKKSKKKKDKDESVILRTANEGKKKKKSRKNKTSNTKKTEDENDEEDDDTKKKKQKKKSKKKGVKTAEEENDTKNGKKKGKGKKKKGNETPEEEESSELKKNKKKKGKKTKEEDSENDKKKDKKKGKKKTEDEEEDNEAESPKKKDDKMEVIVINVNGKPVEQQAAEGKEKETPSSEKIPPAQSPEKK